MEIVIFRHANALSIVDAKVDKDCDRPLSQKGLIEIEKSAVHLKEEGFSSSIIITSPFKRAVESGKVIAKIFNIADIEISPFLLPDSIVLDFISYINTRKENLIIVGHMPFVSRLLYSLSLNFITLSTGEYVRLDYVSNKAKILSRYNPC